MNIATAEETAKLLPSNFDGDESYFIEYAIQKEIINRNRIVASRRLLSQAGVVQQADGNSTNSNLPKVLFLFVLSIFSFLLLMFFYLYCIFICVIVILTFSFFFLLVGFSSDNFCSCWSKLATFKKT